MDQKLSSLNKPAFGTDKIHSSQVIHTAIEAGYRHLDSATGYGNHTVLAEGIKESCISRHELFLASKLNQDDLPAIEKTTHKICKELQTDYLDLLYLHTPNLATPEVLQELDSLRTKGIIKGVGISNIDTELLSKIIDSGYNLDAIQVELHPYYWDANLVKKCQEHKVHIIGYRPLGGGKTNLLENTMIRTISENYSKNTSQIILRWILEKGIIPVVKSQSSQRQQENLNIFDFSLKSSDTRKIDSLKTVNQPTCNWQKKCYLTVL